MSSSRNSQNLLVNVFRPTYVYDGSSFSSAVVASNVKSIDVDTVRAGIVELGDAGGNVYLGKSAGTVYAESNSNSNNSAFGVNAASGISNVKNSVFIGSGAGQGLINASNTVVIGAGSTISGTNNVVVGNNDFITGSNNFVLANDVTLTGSYKINVGNLITGDISAKTLAFQTGISVSGDTVTTGNVGIKYPNPTRALDVSGSIYATRSYLAQDGSQNTPAYTFLSDQSAGIFRDASGSIGFAKGGSYSMKLDPSGSLIYTDLIVNGTLTCTSFRTSGTSTDNVITEGYTRNKAIDWTMDLSQGNFRFTGTGQSAVAGVSFRDSSINAPNGITGTNFALSSAGVNVVDISYSGKITNTNSANENKIGGVTLQASNVLPGPGENHAPSYTFAVDPSLGLYRVGPSALGFTSAGSNRMTISGGFVGIGTTAPGARLTVIGDISATTGISGSNITTNGTSSNSIGGVVLNSNDITFSGKITGSSDTTSNKIGGVIIDSGNLRASNGIVGTPSYSFSNDSNLGMYRVDTNALGFASAGSNRMTISGGFVGIGTITPRTPLDVSGDISGSGEITLANGSVSVPTYTFNADPSLGMYRVGTNALGFASAGSNRMTISGGFVGIGRPVPRTALDVSGDISGSGKITIANGSALNPTYTFTSSPNAGMYLIGTNQIGFSTGGLNNMTISNSFVGIGTTTPTTALDVASTITTSNLNYRGSISNSRFSSSNYIGGVVLSNRIIRVEAEDTFMVGVGTGTNSIATSTDGTSWTGRGTSIFSTGGYGVAWNGSYFVAVGQGSNTIATSTDGITWTGRGTSVFTTMGKGVAWNGSVWVAVGEGTNTIATSTDGATWSGLGTSIFSTYGAAVAWNGSYFVAVGKGTNTIATSVNGTNWSGQDTSIFTQHGLGVAWNGSTWVAVGVGTNTIATSTDGIIWTGRGTSTFSTQGSGVAWNGLRFVAVGQGTNTIAYSDDGSSWTGVEPGFSSYGLGVAWNGSLWVAVGQGTNNILTSPDGDTWNGRGSVFTNAGYAVASRKYVLPLSLGQFTSISIVSNAITNAVGSVSVPSYTFLTDASLGLYRVGASALGFASGGSNRMTISGDRVGIGTITPVTALQVGAKIGDDAARAYDTTIPMFIQQTPTRSTVLDDKLPVLYLGRQGFPDQAFGSLATLKLSRWENSGSNSRTRMDIDVTHNNFNDVTVMSIRSDGRVGIGRTAPVVALDVSGDISGTNVTLTGRITTGSGTSNSVGGVILNNTAISTTGTITTGADGSNSIAGVQLLSNGLIRPGAGSAIRPSISFSNDTSSGIWSGGTDIVNIGTGGSNRFTVFGARVGIAAPAPDSTLQIGSATPIYTGNPLTSNHVSIIGSARASPTYAGTSDMNATLWVSSSNTFASNTGASIALASRSYDYGGGELLQTWARLTGVCPTDGPYQGNLVIETSSAGSLRERMRINQTGSVGIGTPDPVYQLDVSTVTTLAAINMNTWPRASARNVLIARGIAGYAGNTINWSNTAQNAIDSNLMTVVLSNSSNGSSFRVQKSGIWSIRFTSYSTTNQHYTWIDVCTNDVSSVSFTTAGSPWIGIAQAAVNYTDFSFTGYLPSNNGFVYKTRANAAPGTGNSNYLQIAFLYETPNASGNFPFY